MGAIGGILGTAGGANGSGFNAPERAGVQQGATVQDVQQAQGGVNNSLAGQQALLAALQYQNGLGNQQGSLSRQQNLANSLGQYNAAGNQANAVQDQAAMNSALARANGIGTQQNAISGLQNLAQRQQGTEGLYQNIAQGVGPNPAQAMLNQQTGQNVANQAALMAGQRGASSNVGLLARQAAQQGAATQQQAVGQGATMQSQQQLNALAGLSNQQAAQAGTQQAIGGLGTTQAGMQQAGILNQANIAAQQLAAQQAANQAAANQSNLLAGQQIATTQGLTQANLANSGQLQNSLAGFNSANVGAQSSVNAANAGLASKNMEGQQDTIGGLENAAGPILKELAKGGEVSYMADGGEMQPVPVQPVAPVAPVGPTSSFGQYIVGNQAPAQNPQDQQLFQPVSGSHVLQKGTTNLAMGVAKSLKSKAPAGEYAGTDASSMGGNTMVAAKGGLASKGGKVKAASPSQKAERVGDSYNNDKVPALLSEGEIVVPRSIAMGKDPVKDSAAFVQKVILRRKAQNGR